MTTAEQNLLNAIANINKRLDSMKQYTNADIKSIRQQLNHSYDFSNMPLEEAIAYKIKEVGKQNTSMIEKGTDIELSDGTFHFSMTLEDQVNLLGIPTMINMGMEKIPYHSDSHDCSFYSVEDANTIASTTMKYKIYWTTYCNLLNQEIRAMTTKEEVLAVQYGQALTEEKDAILKEITGKSTIAN